MMTTRTGTSGDRPRGLSALISVDALQVEAKSDKRSLEMQPCRLRVHVAVTGGLMHTNTNSQRNRERHRRAQAVGGLEVERPMQPARAPLHAPDALPFTLARRVESSAVIGHSQ